MLLIIIIVIIIIISQINKISASNREICLIQELLADIVRRMVRPVWLGVREHH